MSKHGNSLFSESCQVMPLLQNKSQEEHRLTPNSIVFLCEEKGGQQKDTTSLGMRPCLRELAWQRVVKPDKKSWPRKSPNIQCKRMKFSWASWNPEKTGREHRWMRHVDAQTGWVENDPDWMKRLNQKPHLKPTVCSQKSWFKQNRKAGHELQT